MPPSEKPTFMVSFELSLRLTVRKRLQARSRDVLRLAAAGADEIYMRMHSYNIFGMTRLMFCN